jgi:translation initiation factor IF-1
MLKVKIADFLGKSRWKFKLADGRTIEAKITDTHWLNMFHLKSAIIGPGDSIEVQGVVKDMYDDNGKLIDSDYTITKVVKIHEAENQREIDL